MSKRKILFYQSHFCQMGGVETMAYNWCWWLRNYFDVTVLYCSGDEQRLYKMGKLVNLEKYEEGKEYECDIFIRNSVWGTIPKNIKAKRMIEMRHADYKFLLDKGILYNQYAPMGINEIVACGEYVAEMSNKTLNDNPTVIKNILLPKKETNKILHLISCTRIDPNKGWERMLKLMDMLRAANIKFDWKIFTNSTNYKCYYEEVHFYKQRYDIWDYLADADYTVLLSDSEGLPYTVQESLLYQVPCIVTDVGGCRELIKDSFNGYVVPLDMNFDVNKLLKIPKCPEYDNQSLETWLKFLNYKGKIDKEKLIEKYREESDMEIRVKCIMRGGYDDIKLKRHINEGEEYIVDEDRAEYLKANNAIEILEKIKVEKPIEETKKVEDKIEYDVPEDMELKADFKPTKSKKKNKKKNEK